MGDGELGMGELGSFFLRYNLDQVFNYSFNISCHLLSLDKH